MNFREVLLPPKGFLITYNFIHLDLVLKHFFQGLNRKAHCSLEQQGVTLRDPEELGSGIWGEAVSCGYYNK